MQEQRECITRNLHVYKGKKKPDSNLVLHAHCPADTEQKYAVFRTRGLTYSSVKQKLYLEHYLNNQIQSYFCIYKQEILQEEYSHLNSEI